MQRLAISSYGKYVPRMGRAPAPMADDYAAVVASGHAWVAEHGDQLVGLLVTQPAEGHLLLENIAVAPSAQNMGLGSRLLRLAERHALAMGLPEIRLYTNEAMTENLDYYPRRGYHETHRATQNGYQRVFFSKVLVQGDVLRLARQRRTAAEALASSHSFERSSDQPNTSRVRSRPSMP